MSDIIDKRLISVNEDLCIPVVITTESSKRCKIYVPDFDITIHGKDYITTMAHAIMSVSAIYYYNIERNVKMSLTATYAEAEKMCKGKNMFATYLTLTA